MITRTVQLDPFRNPDLDAEQVEAELKSSSVSRRCSG